MPLTLHDLPARETYIQIAASLKALQEAVNGVFARIEGAVDSRRGECLVICHVLLCCNVKHHCTSFSMSQHENQSMLSSCRAPA